MASEGGSFLPRILSVFYAVFDEKKGPCIVYQVPEDLIAAPAGPSTSTSATNGVGSPSIATFSAASEASTSTAVSQNSSLTRNSRIDRARSGNARSSGRKQSSNSASHSREHRREQRRSRTGRRSPSGGTSVTRQLFQFEEISRYVMPHSILCGRLVTCATRHHRVIGFPVELYGKYYRNFFRFNVCFVFDRTADLSCYEPIVRKIGRVLTACEEESCFLSSQETSPKIHAILEQLYEDLNSYSETSIPIDRFNSIELKIFPFYPNPPAIRDWDVPVALINLKKRIEDNWDLTMAKICPLIDGTNHVSRIAFLADCDIGLTRKAISHLMYYQVIMMIDIFQFSNMYTLSRSIQWLADEAHVREECGPYVTRSDREIPEWPKLLHLYSRLKPGVTIYDWVKQYNTDELGIDPRRFVSFGVIKGFLRRVHRWPVLLPGSNPELPPGINTTPLSTLSMSRSSAVNRGRRSPTISISRRRGRSLVMPVPAAPASSPSGLGAAGILVSGKDPSAMPPNLHLNTQVGPYGHVHNQGGHVYGGYTAAPSGSGAGDTPPVSAGTTGSGNTIGIVMGAYGAFGTGAGGPVPGMTRPAISRRETYDERRNGRETYERVRRNSAAEKSLEQFRSGMEYGQTGRGIGAGVDSTTTSPRTLRFPRTQDGTPSGLARDREDRQRRLSLQQQHQPTASSSRTIYTSPHRHSAMAPITTSHAATATGHFSTGSGIMVESKSNSYGESGSGSGAATPTPTGIASTNQLLRGFASNRLSRSPSTPMVYGPHTKDMSPPDGLRDLLDGTRHTDELGVMFEAGWPMLERWLCVLGGGRGDGDLGRVVLIIR